MQLKRENCSTAYSYQKKKRPKINDQNIHFKKPKNKYQIKPKASTKQEIIKIRAEIGEIE